MKNLWRTSPSTQNSSLKLALPEPIWRTKLLNIWAKSTKSKDGPTGCWATPTRSVWRPGWKLIEAISMVQFLLPGTPFTYYGDEIGMKDVLLPAQSDVPCPTENQLTAQSHCNQARSPYQWDSTPETAGFTKAKPWYPVGDNVDTVNAKTQMETQLIFFNVYRELVNLRTKAAIMYGTLSILNVTTDDIFAFTRLLWTNCNYITIYNYFVFRIRKGAPGYLIVVNLGQTDETVNFEKEHTISEEAQVVLRSTMAVSNLTTVGSRLDTTKVPVGPQEGLVLSFVPNFWSQLLTFLFSGYYTLEMQSSKMYFNLGVNCIAWCWWWWSGCLRTTQCTWLRKKESSEKKIRKRKMGQFFRPP